MIRRTPEPAANFPTSAQRLDDTGLALGESSMMPQPIRPRVDSSSIVLRATAVLVLAVGAHAQGVTTVVSANAQGALGNQASNDVALTPDGRYVAFMSQASNLLATPTAFNEKIFVLDRATGVLEREDVTQAGVGSSVISGAPSISADGRFVAFDSRSDDLGGFGQNTPDVYVRDRQTGVLECLSSTPGQQGLSSAEPKLSGDGRYVAYIAQDVVTPGQHPFQVYVYDRNTSTRTLASVDSNGVPANATCSEAVISRDGRWVAFTSDATNLVASDTNLQPDIFLRDLVLGVTTIVSVSTAGAQSDDWSFGASISGDGRYVVFSSFATNLTASAVNFACAYVRDTLLGTTEIVSRTPTGAIPNGDSYATSITGDARFILFQSNAADVVPGDANGTGADIFVWDRATNGILMASLGTGGEAFGPNCYHGVSSDDGHLFAFVFSNTSLTHIAVHDRTISFASTFCAGGVTCPCGNNGSHGAGCENSFGTGGARLAASGNASVTTDAFVLHADDMPPTTAVLFFQGTSKVNNGAGTVFGDGLLCVGGAVIRLGAKNAVNGSAVYGGPAGDIPISVRGAVTYGGLKRYYQAWYRNVDPGYCTASPFNLTNGVEMHWAF
jgi:hypothetical protein